MAEALIWWSQLRVGSGMVEARDLANHCSARTAHTSKNSLVGKV